MQATADARGMSVDELFEYFKNFIQAASDEGTGTGSYTKYDDWSIPEADGDGHPNRLLSSGYVLKNGNVLPEYWNDEKTEWNQEGYNAIKQELLNGHGVNIAFHADQSGQYTMSDVDPNTGDSLGNMYNQYVWNPAERMDHGVCIVGWDDNYPATNFQQEAPGNGAWIVKNSWGSTKDAAEDDLGNKVGSKAYGFQENGEYTGCFYLSYYDKSIQMAETMEFSQNLGDASGSFAVLQHDYQPASQGFYTTPETSDVMSTANVFSTEDTPITLKSVSTRTAEANMRVTFAVYEMNENAQDPTDGTLLYRTSQNFEYGGYHRLDLDQPISFAAGKKFSIVATSSVVENDGSRLYSAAASRGASKTAADNAREQGVALKAWSEAVVNEGESWLYKDGGWVDWKNYLEELPADAYAQDVYDGAQKYTDALAVDNFSIKAYVEPVDDSQQKALEEAEQARKTAEDKAAAAAAQKTAEDNAAAAAQAQKAAEDKAAAAAQGQKAAEDKAAAAVNAQKAAESKATAAAQAQKNAEKKAATATKAQKNAEKKAASALKANPMTVKGKTVTAKAKKKTTIKKSKAFTVKKAKGKVSFYKISGDSKITVSKAGKVTVKAGLKAKKKGYKVKVLVCAAGGKVKGENYAPSTKTVTLTVKVKK